MSRPRNIIYNIGNNNADYNVNPDGNMCPFYRVWVDVLRRCGSEKFQRKYPSYVGCSITESWVDFMDFREWMSKQNWEGKQLDKDVLFRGNKLYSEDTCVFVTQEVNKVLLCRSNDRGEYPIGVCWHKQRNKYKAAITRFGKNQHIGLYDCQMKAHSAWQREKVKQINIVASMQDCDKVISALRERAFNIERDMLNGVETLYV